MTNDTPILKAVADAIRDHTRKAFDVLRDRLREQGREIETLRQEVAELRERGGMSLADAHRGTHQRGCRYARGSLVTHAGGVWLALEDTVDRPGSSDCWRLIVKGS